jgi:hypothetical protein
MPGLTLAANMTGKPEMVTPGGFAMEAEQPVHVHVHLDSKEIWRSMQKETLKYQIRNTGRSNTGGWVPS